MRNAFVSAGLVMALVCSAEQLVGQADEYRDPACEMDMGHFLVKTAITYIKGATEEESSEKRVELLVDAQRNLIEAIQTDQADNPAVWYFLGRYYVVMNDPAGADTAFARVQQALPACEEDIQYYRQTSWVRAVNRGIDSIRNGAYDGARNEFRAANHVWTESNVSYFYLASIYADEGEIDSALQYFRKVTEIGTSDTAHLDNYSTAVENMATLFYMVEDWDSTVVWYQKVRELDPSNTDALVGLAEAYTGLGDQTRALALYDSVLNDPNMSDLDLFSAGVKLFNADQFGKAADAFENGLKKNPNHRDALYNLANTYLALANESQQTQTGRDQALQRMDAVTHRLLEIDPKSTLVHRILAAAHQLQGLEDTTRVIMDEMDALTYEVVVDLSRPQSGVYLVAGRVVNLEESQTAFPSITFEFLDDQGNVVTTESIPGDTLEAKGNKRFSFNRPEPSIKAWRYKAGS